MSKGPLANGGRFRLCAVLYECTSVRVPGTVLDLDLGYYYRYINGINTIIDLGSFLVRRRSIVVAASPCTAWCTGIVLLCIDQHYDPDAMNSLAIDSTST